MALRLHLRNGVYLADCVIGGKNRLETLGIVDSGASVTYVTTDTLSQAKLEPTGEAQKFLCVHGKNHAGIETRSYHGTVTLGTKSGSRKAYAIDTRLAVGGLRAGAVLGRDVLCHFNVDLHWMDGTGLMAA